MKILFCRIGWMKEYCGKTYTDPIMRKHEGLGYLPYNTALDEEYNFCEYDGKYYGLINFHFFENDFSGIPLEKFQEGNIHSVKIEGVLVVWVASSPELDKNVIVGWYRNATVYRHYQEPTPFDYYNIVAEPEDCFLLAPEKRSYTVNKAEDLGMNKAPLECFVWFPSDFEDNKELFNMIQYINDPNHEKINTYNKQSIYDEVQEVYQDSQDQLLKIIKTSYEEDDFIKSIKHCNALLQKHPLHKEALRMKGLALFAIDHFESGKKVFDILEKRYPTDSDTLLNLGLYHLRNWNVESSLKYHNKAAAMNPLNHEAYFNKAGLFHLKFDHEKAIRELRKAMLIDPENEKYKEHLEFFIKANEEEHQ